MKIPNEFKGTIYIYWYSNYGFLCFRGEEALDDDLILLGSVDVGTVKLRDGRQAAIEALEKQIADERAASAHRIAVLQGRVQEMLALEVGGE